MPNLPDDPALIVDGLLLAAHLMAAADGKLHAREIDQITEFARSLSSESITRDEVRARAETIRREQYNRGSADWAAVFAPYRALSPASKELILQGALTVSISDHDFAKAEQHMVVDLGNWLGMDEAARNAVVEQVLGGIGG